MNNFFIFLYLQYFAFAHYIIILILDSNINTMVGFFYNLYRMLYADKWFEEYPCTTSKVTDTSVSFLRGSCL